MIHCLMSPLHTQNDSRIGLWAGSKRRKSILEQRAGVEEYEPPVQESILFRSPNRTVSLHSCG